MDDLEKDEMATKLVIVESPAKAKSIGKFLGKEYKVLASKGHIRDLPEHAIGVDIEHGFEPKYVLSKDKTKTVIELKKAAKESEEIFLAPDPDREGEAIAWHLHETLLPAAKDKTFYRVQYNEITPRAVREAIAHPGQIDMDRVNAQQARRVLDRIVGYMVSPMLWRRIRRGLSAGRVQSVALRLLAERERADRPSDRQARRHHKHLRNEILGGTVCHDGGGRRLAGEQEGGTEGVRQDAQSRSPHDGDVVRRKAQCLFA